MAAPLAVQVDIKSTGVSASFSIDCAMKKHIF